MYSDTCGNCPGHGGFCPAAVIYCRLAETSGNRKTLSRTCSNTACTKGQKFLVHIDLVPVFLGIGLGDGAELHVRQDK